MRALIEHIIMIYVAKHRLWIVAKENLVTKLKTKTWFGSFDGYMFLTRQITRAGIKRCLADGNDHYEYCNHHMWFSLCKMRFSHFRTTQSIIHDLKTVVNLENCIIKIIDLKLPNIFWFFFLLQLFIHTMKHLERLKAHNTRKNN